MPLTNILNSNGNSNPNNVQLKKIMYIMTTPPTPNPPPKKPTETQITTGIQDNQHNLKSDVACATESWLQGIKSGQNPT